MKIFFKNILKYYLKYVTKLVLFINRPTVIAIAGSTNKTFTKERIIYELSEMGLAMRSNPKSFNTEIGLPLAILNLPSGYNFYKLWLPIIIKAFLAIFAKNFPKILVLELGVSNPGDMKYLLSIIDPKIAIITGITQRYLESFSDMDELVDEYEYLVKKIKRNGVVILNYDNAKVRAISEKAKAKIIFFSSIETGGMPADFWQATEIKKELSGQTVKIKCGGNISRYIINRFGHHHIYSLLASLIVKDQLKSV